MEDKEYTVIVVEDEELILQSILRKIKRLSMPWKIIGTAEDGQTALSLIQMSPPDVLMTDIRIPVMDGLELIDRVNYEFPSVKKVIISGYNDFEYTRKAICTDVFDYLLKPVKTAEFQAMMERLFSTLQLEHEETLKAEGKDSRVIVDMVKNYIRSSYQQEINVNLLAEKFQISPVYLSKMMLYHKS